MLTVVNFAHGAFYMVGAYAGLYLASKTGNFWIAMLLAPILVGLLGMLCERWLIRPLYGRGIDYPLLLTFGLAYMMVEAIRMIFGRAGLPFDTPEVLQGSTNLGFADFPTYRLFVIAVVAAVLAALWLFIEKTSLGLIVRAGARDPVIVRVLGVDVSRVWLLVFGVGTGQPRGLTSEINDRLNHRLRDSLSHTEVAMAQLGVPQAEAQSEVTALFAHTVGLLVLSHTGRIRMFKRDSQGLFDSYLEPPRLSRRPVGLS